MTTRSPRRSGYDKAEIIHGPAHSGPCRTVDEVELATLWWVHWHNTTRLHGYSGDLPPAEFKASFYAGDRTDQPLVESNSSGFYQTECASDGFKWSFDITDQLFANGAAIQIRTLECADGSQDS